MLRIEVIEVENSWLIQWFEDEVMTHQVMVRKKEITNLHSAIAQLRNARTLYGAKVS